MQANLSWLPEPFFLLGSGIFWPETFASLAVSLTDGYHCGCALLLFPCNYCTGVLDSQSLQGLVIRAKPPCPLKGNGIFVQCHIPISPSNRIAPWLSVLATRLLEIQALLQSGEHLMRLPKGSEFEYLQEYLITDQHSPGTL